MFYLKWLAENWRGYSLREAAAVVKQYRESMGTNAPPRPTPKIPTLAAIERKMSSRAKAPTSYSADECASPELKAILDKTPADAF